MRVLPIALAALLAVTAGAPTAGAQAFVEGRRCATPSPTVTEALARAEIAQQHRDLAALRVGPEPPVTVPVVFHIISDEGAGDVPLATLQAQVDTLNTAFRTTRYRFALSGVNRVENADWYHDLRLGSGAERAMKRALQLDPSRVMNVYSAALGLDYLGWATLPYPGSEFDETDGVVLLDASMPGGPAAPYNLGHTGTHEVGHWLGLDHTFSGGCSEPNDGVADTPQEASPASGCPTGRDSCPMNPGEDPIRNYMDYSYDACMDSFTPGQAELSNALVDRYRGTLVAGGYAVASADASLANLFVNVPTTVPVRVTNASDAPLAVTGATSAGADASLAPTTIAPGAVAVLDLALTPRASGDFSVRIETDAGGPDALVTVSGSAFLPPIARLDDADLAATLLEGQFEDVTVEIANDGGGPLTFDVDAAALPSWVASVAPTAGTVAPGETAEIAVRLTAVNVAPSAYARTLDIDTNDPLKGTVEVALALDVLVRPDALAVNPPFPNPAQSVVTVPLELPAESVVTADVYDARGRRVASLSDGRPLPAGYPTLTWDTSRVPAGVYVVRIATLADAVLTRVVVVR